MRQAIRAPIPRAAFRPLLIVLLAAISTACLKETRRVHRPPVTLPKATLEDLTQSLREIATPSSLKATVELELTVLNEEQTKGSTYKEVRGAVVGRRPGAIRVQAQVPVTGQRAFDMTTAGETFQVYLPWKNRVYEGENTLDVRSDNRAENIRPHHILEPILIDPIRDDETPVLLNTREGRTGYQVVQLLRRDADGALWIARSAWFRRADFQLDRYMIYSRGGDVVTVARYQGWQQTPEGPRPGYVAVSRPEDGYDLAVRFLKPAWDAPVDDSAFDLDAPDDVKVVRVGEDEIDEDGEPTAASVR